MRLRDIYDKLVKFNSKRFELAEDYVNQACEDLIPLLLKLKDYKEVAVCEYSDAWCVDIRFIHKYLAIRYCGRFVNMIMINKEGWGSSRISLRYLYIESDSEYNRFPDDQYKKDSDEFRIQPTDTTRLCYFIGSLVPFFKGGIHEEEYNKFWRSQGDKIKDIDTLDDTIAEEINENMEHVFFDIFDKHFGCQKVKKRFLKLPHDVSIRYRGKFHNCIVDDYYCVSLGYIKDLHQLSEDEYGQDPYTIELDSARYPEKDFILLHEISLRATESNGYNLMHALKTLLDLCENEMESGDLIRLTGGDVEYIKTPLTD